MRYTYILTTPKGAEIAFESGADALLFSESLLPLDGDPSDRIRKVQVVRAKRSRKPILRRLKSNLRRAFASMRVRTSKK